jgi:hypothetical protein
LDISFCLDRLLLLFLASSHPISPPLHFLHLLQIQIDFNFESD